MPILLLMLVLGGVYNFIMIMLPSFMLLVHIVFYQRLSDLCLYQLATLMLSSEISESSSRR